MFATPFRSSRMDSAPATPSKLRNMFDHSNISTFSSTNSSPSHAELLAHSLSIVAAASAASRNSHEEGFRESGAGAPRFQLNLDKHFVPSPIQSPYLTSAFSDYGSSECSSAAYTPADSEIDPFEYDSFSHHSSLHTPDPPPPDNFNLFAAAIKMHSLSNTFVLPSFPPKRLVEKRPDKFGASPTTTPPQDPIAPQDPFAASFAEAIVSSPQCEPEAPVLCSEDDPIENTLAIRRQRSGPKDPSCPRAHSYMGAPERTYPVLRRINTDGANSGRISPYGIVCPDTAATIRPRTASSSTRPLSELFQVAPPTPPSPGGSQAQYLQADSEQEMSPPATPQRAIEIPRYYEDVLFGPTSVGSDDEDAFVFDYCPPALPSSATISGGCFF